MRTLPTFWVGYAQGSQPNSIRIWTRGAVVLCCFAWWGLFVFWEFRETIQNNSFSAAKTCRAFSFFEGFHKSVHQRMFSTQRWSKLNHCPHLKLKMSVIFCWNETSFDKTWATTFNCQRVDNVDRPASLWCVLLTGIKPTKGSVSVWCPLRHLPWRSCRSCVEVQKRNPDFRIALQQAEEQMAQQGGVVDRRFWIHLKQQRFYFETPRHRLICSIGFSYFMGFYSVSCNLLIKNYAQHIRISDGSIRVRSAMHSQCCALREYLQQCTFSLYCVCIWFGSEIQIQIWFWMHCC